jgi:hypothetical protein
MGYDGAAARARLRSRSTTLKVKPRVCGTVRFTARNLWVQMHRKGHAKKLIIDQGGSDGHSLPSTNMEIVVGIFVGSREHW